MAALASSGLRPADLGEIAVAQASRPRILLVDDDERNLLALSEVLEELAEIETATSGRDALRHLLKSDFAVILLDVFMPGMDGYETARLIRERQQTARIPIIFVSAVSKETEHLMRGYAMGAVDYVFKPVDPVVLRSKVSVFVDLHRMRLQIEEKSRAEQQLIEATYRAELKRLQAEQELQASRRREEAILDALPLALYEETQAADGTLRRRFIAGDLMRVSGLAPGDFAGDETLWHANIHPDDRAAAMQTFVSRERETRSCEYRWLASDGEIRHFLDQRMLMADGPAPTWAGTLIDMTAQKRLEAQVLQAGKMEAIGQLTGGIAHDFNNLLAAVLGGVQLLSRRVALSESDRRIVELMRHAAEHGAELVRRMMAFARRQELSPTRVQARALCDSVAGLVEHVLGGTVTLDWCCEACDVLFVDRGQIELALLNLIVNGRDALPQGGVIKVTLHDKELPPGNDLRLPPGRYVVIAVSDTGTGIAPEHLGRITEPFFTTKEAGKGTGLGLSMVLGFVQQSGGALNIRSVEGRGTTVEMVIPAASPESETEAPPPASETVEPTVASVLLVDDDEAVRTVLCEQLRDRGLKVCAVADGESALARLRETAEDYDLLLTDFAMPGLNGAETISQALELRPSLKTALMTGYTDEASLASLGGGVALLRKPIAAEALDRVLA